MHFLKLVFVVSVFFIFGAFNVQSQTATAIPDTPAGKQLSEWLRVFSQGSQEEFKNFIFERFANSLLTQSPATDRADRQARTYLDARKFNIRDIEKSEPHEIVTLAQADLTGLWFRLTLKVEPQVPYRITEYTSQRIPPPGKLGKLTQRELIRKIETFMNRLAEADAYSGTLLVAKDDKILFRKAYGLASKAHNLPNRTGTILNIASITKMFTATAIMQLVEKGKLSFSDTVGQYVPEYPNKDVREKVTIHHLLSHTSGLGDFYGAKFYSKKTVLRQVKDYFQLFPEDPPLFEPGKQWQYSNIGYLLLGAIIEKVTGENFFEHIHKNVFRPAGMTDTDYYEADVDTPNLATGYTNFDDLGDDNFAFRLGKRRNTSLYNNARGGPQGGAASTLDDLWKFSRALREHKLISRKSYDLMTTVKVVARKYDAGQTLWGYGVEMEIIDGKRVLGHGGGDLGISSAIRWFPDSGNYTVIILSNYDRGGILASVKLQELIIRTQ